MVGVRTLTRTVGRIETDTTARLAANQRASQAPADAAHLRLVTIPVAAQLLGVSRSKLYELLAQGELPTVRIGRSRRIAIADLDAFAHRCRDAG